MSAALVEGDSDNDNGDTDVFPREDNDIDEE
jgi:hypothetical protein